MAKALNTRKGHKSTRIFGSFEPGFFLDLSGFSGLSFGSQEDFLVKIAGVFMLLLGVSAVAMAAPPGFGAPEIDPGSAVTALTFVSGAMLLVRGRRRK
jgi:hypothetical protein